MCIVYILYIEVEECARPYEKRLIGKWFLSFQQNVKRQGLKRLLHSPLPIDGNAVEMWPMAVQRGSCGVKGQCVREHERYSKQSGVVRNGNGDI